MNEKKEKLKPIQNGLMVLTGMMLCLLIGFLMWQKLTAGNDMPFRGALEFEAWYKAGGMLVATIALVLLGIAASDLLQYAFFEKRLLLFAMLSIGMGLSMYLAKPLFVFMMSVLLTVFGAYNAALEKSAKLRRNEWIRTGVFLGIVLLEIVNGFRKLWYPFLTVALVFSALFFYYLVQELKSLPVYFERKQKAGRLELELFKHRVDTAYSQMQPHFLYNTLGTIAALCKREPEQAAEACRHFSEYMRGNISSLNKRRLCDFSEELAHVRTYLSLESMRFADVLHVEYDIQEEEFSLPVLSLQPLVENAIMHGMMTSEADFLLQISTVKNGDQIEIRITDNGAGCSMEELTEKEKTHVGIASVRKRLHYLCDGTLSITSEKGAGCEALITIPVQKEEQKIEI